MLSVAVQHRGLQRFIPNMKCLAIVLGGDTDYSFIQVSVNTCRVRRREHCPTYAVILACEWHPVTKGSGAKY